MKYKALWFTFLILFSIGCRTYAEQELPVFNGNFEILPTGALPTDALGKPPLGWAVTAARSERVRVELADDCVADGHYALRIVAEEKTGIHLSSRPIKVEPGKTYVALWQILNVNRPPLFVNYVHAYMEFFPDDGWWGTHDYWSEQSWKDEKPGAWTTKPRVGVYFTSSTKHGEWEDVVVQGTSPVNARYMTISLWVPSRTLYSYVDGIRLAVLD